MGRSDPTGLTSSVPPAGFIIDRLWLYEKVLREMNEIERKTSTRSGVIYIFDMQGLVYDVALIGIMTGPMQVLLNIITSHYPEVMAKILVVNAPRFLSILFNALKPFLPQRTL